RQTPDGEQLIAQINLTSREKLIGFSLPDDIAWESLLENGRLPRPGTNEVLAGAFCRLGDFKIGEAKYSVTGTIPVGAAGFAFFYVLPDGADNEAFSVAQESTTGWLHPIGQPLLLRDAGKKSKLRVTGLRENLYYMKPAGLDVAAAVLACLTMMAIAGTLFHARVFRGMALTPLAHKLTVFAESVHFKKTFYLIHALFFGEILFAMMLGILTPMNNMRLSHMLSNAFTSGPLMMVTRAYESGNILWASMATFGWNYFVATLVLTVAPSIVFPPWGLLKNALSFGLIGFAMAPLWTDLNDNMTYHSLTMVFELEAYIVVCFAITVYALRIIRGLRTGRLREQYLDGLRCLGSGALVAGLLLFFAAVYEATTIILLK
ncbi:MAG: hypothetical protein KJ052_14800, partial [Candidatus Hydrogenedentes bacterium]|nr:hypothetical protein [Candidatus Hydrogenedentota bacterium]